MYCPPPSQRDAVAAREFLTEDLKFTSRIVRVTVLNATVLPRISLDYECALHT